jgi:hypothetical protein
VIRELIDFHAIDAIHTQGRPAKALLAAACLNPGRARIHPEQPAFV